MRRTGEVVLSEAAMFGLIVRVFLILRRLLKAPPNILVFHRDYLQKALEATSGRTPFTDSMWVMPDSDAAASQVAKQIDEYFANSSSATHTESEKVFFSDFLSNYRLIFDMAKWLGLIVVVTFGLVAANTASMSIRERRVEIALMRSLGFPSYSILWMLLAESAATPYWEEFCTIGPLLRERLRLN